MSAPLPLDGLADAHMHIYEPGFAIAPGAFHAPEPDATVADYRREMARVGISRAVVVQPTAYGTDNSCTLAAVAALAPVARGIAILSEEVGDAEIARLTAGGIVGLRCFMMKGGRMDWDRVRILAPRVAAHGWHLDIAFHSREFAERLDFLRALPADLVIEHFGYDIDRADGPAMAALLRLLDGGRAWVKLSSPYGVGENDQRHYRDVDEIARRLIAHAPDRCVWGSNWPHAGFKHLVPKPDSLVFRNRLATWTADPAVQSKILASNPARLYGF